MESHTERGLDFTGVLAALHALVGEWVEVEAGPCAGPAALRAGGRFRHLADLQLTFGALASTPAEIAFAVADAWFSLRESEVRSARSYSLPCPGPAERGTGVEIELGGGVWLTVMPDRARRILECRGGDS